MKKLNLVLITLAILLAISLSAFAVIAPANVGPTTNFNGDVGVPSGSGYYINDTLILATDSLTFTGTGTLNGLDAVDATGEDTIEALIFDADTASITGVWTVADDVDLVFGSNSDWAIQYDEAVDDQLLFITAGTACSATTDPMVEFLVGGTPTADQQVFGIAKGTQASNTPLFTVDEDGDILIAGTLGVTGALDLTTPLGAAEGGTGVANNAASTLTISGNYATTLTVTNTTSVTLPTSGILVSDATACTDIEGTGLTITTGVLNIDDSYLLNSGDVGTGVYDFGGADSFEIPNKNADPAVAGQILLDTTVANMTNGALAYFDGTSIRYVVDLAAADVWSTDGYAVKYNATLDKFYMGADNDSGVFAGSFVQHLMDVDAADADYVHAAIVGTGASQDVSTGITNPDYGRNITVTSTAGSVGVVTITGTTADGTNSETDAITIVDGSIAYGVKAFVTVTNINTSAAFISPEEVTIGIGDVIGLANAISAEADIYSMTIDGVNAFSGISGNANTTYNTIDLATVAQNSDYTIYYHN